MLAFGGALFAVSSNDDDYDGDDWWELRKVYNVLVDKELRIHVEIEDGVFEYAERVQFRKKEGLDRRREEKKKKKKVVGRQQQDGRKRRTGREVVYLPDDGDDDYDDETRA